MTKVQVTKNEYDYLETFKGDTNMALYYISRFGWNYGLKDGFDREDNDHGKKWKEILGGGLLDEVRHKLIRAVLDGYELVEQLYTVEIPNPNKIGNEIHVLMMNGYRQVVIVRELGDNWKHEKGFQLTEAEIKKDFDWAWQWAKPVEEML